MARRQLQTSAAPAASVPHHPCLPWPPQVEESQLGPAATTTTTATRRTAESASATTTSGGATADPSQAYGVHSGVRREEGLVVAV